MDNTSGQGWQVTLPQGIKGWSWGAFLWSYFWGIFNITPIVFFSILPPFCFVMPFVLGAMGNEWAWRKKRWQSVAHFKRVQRWWSITGLTLAGITIIGAFYIHLLSSRL